MAALNSIHAYVERGGRGFAEFDVEFKFAKIQNSYVEGGWVGCFFFFAEFDVDFKFAKIQKISMLRVGGWGGLRNLMLSSNLLESKIPMLRVGGWVVGRIRFGLGKKNDKVEILGGGGGGKDFGCVLVNFLL